MIKSDYHVHTFFSSDSDTPMEDMVLQAINLGLTSICFSDHMDYDFPVTSGGLTFVFDPVDYFTELRRLEEKYSGTIRILKGIELGLQPHLNDRYHTLLTQHDFDFAIGSSHLVQGLDPYLEEYWHGRTKKEGLEDYFKCITENVKAVKNFDVYGHLDYAIRYAPNKAQDYSYHNFADVIETMLKAIIEAGKGIELNTSGYKYGLGFPHPHDDILKRYKELGGEIITIGSDGHKTEHLAYDFDRAKNLLISLGYEYYTVFEKRKPHFIELD